MAVPLLIIAALAFSGYWTSYRWTTDHIPKMLSAATAKQIGDLVKDARQSVGLAQVNQHLSASRIFANNIRATLLVFVGGLVSFGVLGVLGYLINVGMVGGVLGVFKLIGYSPIVLFAAGLLPHGVFEIPALMLASAAVLRMGAVIVTPQAGRSMGQLIIELLADFAKIFLGVVTPLLAVAALIEAYVTPSILLAALR